MRSSVCDLQRRQLARRWCEGGHLQEEGERHDIVFLSALDMVGYHLADHGAKVLIRGQ